MQTRRNSLIEAIFNTFLGLVVSWMTWKIIITPIFKIYPSNKEIILISAIFTIISIIRSYLVRRLFNLKIK